MLAASEAFGRPGSRDVEALGQSLTWVASMYAFVIDAGNTLSPSAVAALTIADVVVLVANPDLPCLRNLQRLTDALRLGDSAERGCGCSSIGCPTTECRCRM